MQYEGVGADVSGHDQPSTIHLFTKRPDVDGQRSQVCTGWDEDIGQKDGTAKVQRDEATSSWMEEADRIQELLANPTFYLKRDEQRCKIRAE